MLRGPAGWIVTFTVYDQDRRLGERQLELSSDDCRSHDATLALVVALLLEHGPPQAPVEEPLAEPPVEAAPPSSQQPAPSEREPEPTQDRRSKKETPLHLRGGVGWGVISGWLPQLASGPTTFWGVEVLERASLELALDYYFRDESAGFEDATARMSGGRIHVRGCGLPRWGNWGLSVCGGFGWMGLAATGRETAQAKSVLHGTPEARVSLALDYRMGARFSLEAGVGVGAPFRRGRFVFARGAEEVLVHDTDPILLASHVGVVLTL
jgi:hypothetical protein